MLLRESTNNETAPESQNLVGMPGRSVNNDLWITDLKGNFCCWRKSRFETTVTLRAYSFFSFHQIGRNLSGQREKKPIQPARSVIGQSALEIQSS